jgi:signal transduction histidine kinase
VEDTVTDDRTDTAVERVPPEVLRTLFLFERLDADQLAWLSEHGAVEQHPAGAAIHVEGESATCFYVLLEGTVQLLRRVGGDDVEFNRTDHAGAYAGAIQAYVQDGEPQVYLNTFRAVTDVRLWVLPAADFAHLMREWFPMAIHLLEGLFLGTQRLQATVGQRERLLALGSLTAGLTHELNNPAAAAVRATAALRERVSGMRHKLALLASAEIDRASLARLVEIQEEVVAKVAKTARLSPLEEADREDELLDWLDGHGVPDGWEVAPVLAQGGVDLTCLEAIAASLDPDLVASGIRWMGYTVETEQLMAEIEDAVTRISGLVGSAREYSQLDRAPHQVVDVHDLLDATLVMMAGRIGTGITVVTDYDRTLPTIPAYAAELNQVFTNLIDNAVGAMGGAGTLTVRTGLDGDCVLIEIGDTGPGVPEAIRSRIFDPFFTTKPVGEGTGLGLDISYRIVVKRHHGDIVVDSRPGDTRFRVTLPIVDPAR